MAQNPGNQNQYVTIKGNLQVDGGVVGVNYGETGDHVFGDIKVEGNAEWNAGQFVAVFDGANQTQRDQWSATGTFTIAASVDLDASPINAGAAQENWKWDVLFSATKIEGLPTVTGNHVADYTRVDDGNNPIKRVYLQRN